MPKVSGYFHRRSYAGANEARPTSAPPVRLGNGGSSSPCDTRATVLNNWMSATPTPPDRGRPRHLAGLAGHAVDRSFRQPDQALLFFTASLPTGGG